MMLFEATPLSYFSSLSSIMKINSHEFLRLEQQWCHFMLCGNRLPKDMQVLFYNFRKI
jgi:hypothetical protein